MLRKILIRGLYGIVLLLCIVTTAGIGLLLESKQFVFKKTITEENSVSVIDSSPFPVSVDPKARTIIEADLLGNHTYETLAKKEEAENDTWQAKAVAFFFNRDWYQNLASPVSRIVVIWPGERKEEVVKNVGDVLRWNTEQRKIFTTLIEDSEPALLEGKFYPGEYIAHRGATPAEVAIMIQEKFNTDILNRYTQEVEAKVPLKDALIIASLLEREARDFENMREISGVIWNRLFINMPLQLDATLQYARGGTAKSWWPAVKPADKYVKSPYNTYANSGLPPGPIANPSAASVLAALNPLSTDCIYYFHDTKGNYYCSETYEGHVTKLKAIYGRGS
ncbi:MAG: endolytic transglycosylase MltG [Candidatus Pacebacteria bacterium]|nr:endolytic transglycosylase MltG [Candidatus Paceibacterota bacterium]MBP9842751.1 endolytic transglycosylase MltG [Candidatus Paceibacterota bacterium]